jgi:hypothetical protein
MNASISKSPATAVAPKTVGSRQNSCQNSEKLFQKDENRYRNFEGILLASLIAKKVRYSDTFSLLSLQELLPLGKKVVGKMFLHWQRLFRPC